MPPRKKHTSHTHHLATGVLIFFHGEILATWKWVLLSSVLALWNFRKNNIKWMQDDASVILGRQPLRGPSNTLRRCTAPRYPMLGPSIWVDSTPSKIPQFSSTDGNKSEGATRQVIPAKKTKTLTAQSHTRTHTKRIAEFTLWDCLASMHSLIESF